MFGLIYTDYLLVASIVPIYDNRSTPRPARCLYTCKAVSFVVEGVTRGASTLITKWTLAIQSDDRPSTRSLLFLYKVRLAMFSPVVSNHFGYWVKKHTRFMCWRLEMFTSWTSEYKRRVRHYHYPPCSPNSFWRLLLKVKWTNET